MNQLGYFGKIPHRGDFVRFNLPQSFIKVWDDWLQQVMINGETKGRAWPEMYAKAPAYRFVLSGGIAGNTPWIGVFRASEDKVGRRFPFCLAMSLAEHALPCASIISNSLFFDEADALLDRVMTSDYRFDDLQSELTSMATRHSQAEAQSGIPLSVTCNPPTDAMTIAASTSTALHDHQTIHALLDTVLQQALGEYSIWIAAGKSGVTVINSGLPVDKSGSALIDSEWFEASTAYLDPSTLPGGQAAVGLLSTSVVIEADDQPQEANATLAIPHSNRDEQINTSADAHAEHKPESGDTVQIPDPVGAEQIPSADDWAALDEFADITQSDVAILVPEVEPLELEEDDVHDAPWEQ